MNQHQIPVFLVAFSQGKQVLGTAMLKAHSVGSELGYGPFLAAFVVDPAARRKGVGTAPVAAIEGKGAQLGFDALYSSTDSAGGKLTRRGWSACDKAKSTQGGMVIYRLKLSSQLPST